MRSIQRLTARRVQDCQHPGGTPHAVRLPDGGGLYLQVQAAGTKAWLFRFTLHGKASWIGVGPFPLISLAEARQRATAHRRTLADGEQPQAARALARATGKPTAPAGDTTFRAAALDYVRTHSGAWRSAVHRTQWARSLELHAYPVLADLPVVAIKTEHVLQVLSPIWEASPETASRVRGRIEVVLDAAKVVGWRTGDNPAAWRGHLALRLPSPRRIGARRGHQSALPFAAIGAFMAALAAQGSVSACTLEFLILTAARTSEARGCRWREIDLHAAVWTVPAGRMKAAREHRVPLSPQAIAVLRRQQPLADGPDSFVFQSLTKGGVNTGLSNMALLALLRRMNSQDDAGNWRWADGRTGSPITAHGFRSTFRDWAGEATDFPSELAEIALAHVNRDRVEAAYARGDLLAKRVKMMAAWGEYCTGGNPLSSGSVQDISLLA